MSSVDHQTVPIPRKSRFKLPGIVLLLALLAAGAWYARPFISKPDAQEPRKKEDKGPATVQVQAAQTADVPVYINALGTVTPLHTVTVRSRVDGELIRLAFKEGAMVKAGDLLAEIDPRALQVQLMQAEGQLLKDESLLNNAKIDLDRYKTLLDQDSIAAQQTATQAALVKQYQGTIATDKAQVANARLQLSYTKIKAPISGRLGLRLVDQGNMVRSSDVNGLVVITQVQPIAVLFTVPEGEVALIRKALQTGRKLPVAAYDRNGAAKLADGVLVAMDNQIDVNTGTLKLKSQFANEQQNLFANQFVNIKLRVDTLSSATLIPSAAVQTGQDGAYVYVLNPDQTVTMRLVQLGPTYGEQVVVSKGIAPSESVVIDGIDRLKDGAKVRLGTAREPGALPEAAAKPG